MGAVWTHGHADPVHVSILINETCPEASLSIRTARVQASSPAGLQMQAAVGTLPPSSEHPAAFTASLPGSCSWGALAQPKWGQGRLG